MSTEPQPTQTSAPASAKTQPDVPRPPQPRPEPLPHHRIRHTRISGLWFAVAFFAVVLLFLLIFVVQNNRAVDISYLGMHGRLQLGVALLFAAVCGVLLTILAGAARISQLHAVARRHRRADAQAADARAADARAADGRPADARPADARGAAGAANAAADPGR